MSQAGTITDPMTEMRPIASSERIQALDVVRGFALIGIFLMNIEWFNRPIAELGLGLPGTAQDANWWAGYLIYIFVQGKFWTMFSLLFGMGFAVMLTRAERAGRSFLVPYLRRIAALAVFGALHHIFLWAGDILFSYAVAAMCLLLLLWAPALLLVLLPVTFFLLAALIPGAGDWAGPIGAGLSVVLLGAWFLRSEARLGKGMPWQSLFFFALAVVFLALGAAAGMAPQLPVEARWPLLIGCGFMTLLGWLSWRYKDPAEARPRRLGGTMYLVPFCVMLAFGLLQMYGPARPKASEAQVAAAMVVAKAEKAREEAGLPEPKMDAAAQAKEEAKSPTEKAAAREAGRRLQLAEQAKDIATERKLQTTGSYLDFVRFRAKEFAEHAPGEFGFAAVLIGMFLLGYWFVRTGIMEHPAEHLPLFRRMAMVGLPLGVGLGIFASLITTHASPGMDRDPYQTAVALMMIGNLPACLGYVSLLVLMLHSRSPFAKVSVLAPLGRMALTNYLTHSLVSGLYFYGYAGNHYGMGRAAQVGFVFAVIALQVVFSTWWLSQFRYGPMEWLWRAITYWQLPAFRRESSPALAGSAAA
jgi:uncharacterized membrane protein YeiB